MELDEETYTNFSRLNGTFINSIKTGTAYLEIFKNLLVIYLNEITNEDEGMEE